MEVRRRTRPMVLFTNMQSVERILYAIFYRFNEKLRKTTPSAFLHKQLDVTHFTIRAVLSYALGYTPALCLTKMPKKFRVRFRQGPCQLPPPPVPLPLRVSHFPGTSAGKILSKVGTRYGANRVRPRSFTATLTSGTAGYPDALHVAHFWRQSAGTR